MKHGGAQLGASDLDDCFVELRQNLMDKGPIAELSDPVNNYGLRLTALSSTIKAMHVVAPANADFVSIDPQFNYPDPFGREWRKETDTGMVILQPGQTTEWKVRLELFTPPGGE
jgi:galactose mutarotase-like enzyme